MRKNQKIIPDATICDIEVEAVLYHIFKREQEENPYVEMGVPYIVKICVGKLVRQKMIRADYIG